MFKDKTNNTKNEKTKIEEENVSSKFSFYSTKKLDE